MGPRHVLRAPVPAAARPRPVAPATGEGGHADEGRGSAGARAGRAAGRTGPGRGRAARVRRVRGRDRAGRGRRGAASPTTRTRRPGARSSRAARSSTASTASCKRPGAQRRGGRRGCARGPCSSASSSRSRPGRARAARRARRRRRSPWSRFRASPARSRWTRCRRRAPSPATRRRCWRPSGLPKFFPMLMTAAGTVAAGQGARRSAPGVAGLQAIATARRLGAVVSAFDMRPAVQEQVESLGATFLDLGVRGQETEGGYAPELSAEDQARQQAGARGAIAGLRRRSSRRRSSPAGPRRTLIPADAVAPHAPRVGDRRPGRRGGRQLRADRARGRSSGGRA